jgi:acetyl-CoA C-acetyltransferase
MTALGVRGKACIVGAYEHPTRKAENISHAQLIADVVKGALDDAGLSLRDVDGFLTDSVSPGLGALSMVEYLGLRPRYVNTTDTGGSSYPLHVAQAAQAIALGKCSVAVIAMAGRPRALKAGANITPDWTVPDVEFELPYGMDVANQYALWAQRHMYEFGTTSEQLAWVKVAASHHAQHNPHAMLRKVVTVEDVLQSPMIADPLHLLDCCVISDGGGALVVTSPEIARTLKRPIVTLRGAGEGSRYQLGALDLIHTAAAQSGPAAFTEAGVTPRDIKYAAIYDSFTITVVLELEDLGFCEKGQGGRFVADGNLISGVGKLPVNTDGGGLCNNHPNNRGGMTKTIEAVRQLRGEAHPAVQVKNCDLSVVQTIGGWLSGRHHSATLVLEAS